MIRTSLTAYLALLVTGAANASYLSNAIAQVNATVSELEGERPQPRRLGSVCSGPNGECSVNGCVDLVGTNGSLPVKGFFQFQFLNYQYNPVYYSGVFAILDINFSGSTITPQSFINQVNALAGQTGVTALTTGEAADQQNTSQFEEWLPPSLQQSIVFRWNQDAPPTVDPVTGLSDIYTFAWDLTDATAFQNGLSLGGAFAVPAPGALALLGLAGLAGRRRR
jgi:hypothetical protein